MRASSRKTLLLVIIIQCLLFQNILQEYFHFFQYLDESLAVICILTFLSTTFSKTKISKQDLLMLSIMVVIIAIGIFSNFFDTRVTSIFLMLVDILSIFKFYFVYLGLKNRDSWLYRKVLFNKAINWLSKLLKIYLLTLVFFAILNLVKDIDMDFDIRYGIRSFSFVYGTPGLIINQMSYSLIILMGDKILNNKKNNLWILVTLLLILSTLRLRGIVLALIFTTLCLLLIYCKNKSLVFPSTFISIIVLITGYSQFSMYFLEGNTPRQRFVKGAYNIVINNFPFGSGFASFGSSSAADNYSPIYYDLGFSSYYGMGPMDSLFLNDNYLPMIFGQLGIVGGSLFFLFLFKFGKNFIRTFNSLIPRAKIISSFVLFDVFFSSIQSSYLAHYSVVSLLFIFMLLFNNKEMERLH